MDRSNMKCYSRYSANKYCHLGLNFGVLQDQLNLN